jgi:ABC-type proline/glycine betaine transport system ATPase subunit
MIEGIEISKKFDDNILFNRLNFKIEEGEFVCFIKYNWFTRTI